MTPEANIAAQGRPDSERSAQEQYHPQHPQVRRSPRFSRAATWTPGTIADAKPTHAVGRRDAMYRRCLAASDVMAAAFALVLALTIFGDDALQPATLVALPLVVLVAKFTGLYDRDELVLNKTTLDEAPALFSLATLYTLLIFLGEDVLVNGSLGQAQVLGLWCILFLTSVGGRALARRFARHQSAEERCLVIGASAASLQFANKLHHRNELKATVVGRVPLEPEDYDGAVLGVARGHRANHRGVRDRPRGRRARGDRLRGDARDDPAREVARRAGEHAPARVRGAGVLDRVRQRLRDDGHGRAALRPHPLVRDRQAGARPRRRGHR